MFTIYQVEKVYRSYMISDVVKIWPLVRKKDVENRKTTMTTKNWPKEKLKACNERVHVTELLNFTLTTAILWSIYARYGNVHEWIEN